MDDTSIPEMSPEEVRKAKRRAIDARSRAKRREKRRAENRAYYLANRDKENARARQWKLDNPEHCKAYADKYHAEHQEEEALYNAQYYAEHREECLARAKAYRESHPEQRHLHNTSPYHAAYRAAHLEERREFGRTDEGKAQNKVQLAKRRARKANAPINDFTKAQWRALCRAAGYRCAYCGKQFPFKDLTPDHLTPYADQGSNTLHNVLPCCGNCNSRKKDRPVLKPVQPFLLLPPEDTAAD